MDQNGRPRQSAPGIRSTVSFIIFLDSILGQGATSKVYGGRHKKSGKRVACKVPHMPTMLRTSIDMKRESELLLHLRHPNIVCLEAIEKDQISKENILIMELCTGGSLFDMLEKPEHANGLEEQIFIQVLHDITCGMKYLRDHGLVHRDVKPGNIMCFKDEKGKTIYKLADFGAARELTDEENFTSLHGTEEYLHPNIFERAVLKRPAASPFDARVDLWSIGATLYHIATGSLPFRPQGGRKNSPMMFHLTTKKAPGVISGVQTSQGEGDIDWSTELPETCLLSTALKQLLTPMLAGLLEYNPSRVWSFNRFFEVSQSITSKKMLDVFWVCKASNIKIYSDPTDTFAEFQEHIAAQTKLSASKQIFLLNGEAFRPEGTLSIGQYPSTSKANPIMLCNKENIDTPCPIFPPFVAIMPILHPRFSTQNDYPIAKGAVTAGHILQKRQGELHRMHLHFDHFVQTIRLGLSSDVLKLQACSSQVKGQLSNISRDLDTGRRALSLLTNAHPGASASARGSPQNVDGVTNLVMQMGREINHHRDLFVQCESESRDVIYFLEGIQNDFSRHDRGLLWKLSKGFNVEDFECSTELAHVTFQMENIFKRFQKDKKTGKLSYNEEQIHKMEKLNLGELMKKTTKCIGRCEERWRDRHHELMIWHNKAHNYRMQISRADRLLTPLVERCQVLSETVTDLTSKCWQVVESQMTVSNVGSRLAQQSAKEILLSTSTQTSLPKDDLPYSLTNGSTHQLQGHLTRGVQMAPIRSPTSPERYNRAPLSPMAISGPACGVSQHMSSNGQIHMRSAPAVLVAHGISERPDRPTELSAHKTAPGGDGSQGGSRMIRVPRQLKQDIKNYKMQSDSYAERIQQEMKQLQLEDPPYVAFDMEMPPMLDDSSLLDTLTEGAIGGEAVDESVLDSLDIKRPPTSYSIVSE